MTMPTARFEVARAFGKLTATHEGREYLAANGFTSGTPVIAASYDDEIADVLRRMSHYRDESGPVPCVVAIVKDGELEAITFHPSKVGGEESSEVSRYSCIGMLIAAVKRSGRVERYRFTSTRMGLPKASFSRPIQVLVPSA